jgi:hypothetical protein
LIYAAVQQKVLEIATRQPHISVNAAVQQSNQLEYVTWQTPKRPRRTPFPRWMPA